MLTYNQPFALELNGHGFIKYQRREYGINLVFSEIPTFEWEFRRRGASGTVDKNLSLGLFNRIANDFVVYAEREYGINLRWLKDTKRTDELDWKIYGGLLTFCMGNLTLASQKKLDAYIIYGDRKYGINLKWGKKPDQNNFSVLTSLPLPVKGDYAPGEEKVSAFVKGKNRPFTWTVEWNDNEGLDFDAYNCVIRSPYIQNITQSSATVLWRIGIPKNWDPAEWVDAIRAKAWIAPKSQKINTGVVYETGSRTRPITTEDVTYSYKFESGVRYNKDVPDGRGESDYWLNKRSDRPVIQCKVVFNDLVPGDVYHYRIQCDGILDEDDKSLTPIILANDIYFKMASNSSQKQKVSFLAMGDLGPGDGEPSYFYDVSDLFNKISREYGPNLWLALGDIDNDTDGHPNAMDPFFFNVYNAYHNLSTPTKTSNTSRAKGTGVKSFRTPPYYGLLGGLPVYPTFGNHDICTQQDGNQVYWNKAYKGSFSLPIQNWGEAASKFNVAGNGFYYTFRNGNAIFLSLGIPRSECNLCCGEDWREKWGNAQITQVKKYLTSIKAEIAKQSVWVIAYFHDHNYALARNKEYSDVFLDLGVDLVLAGHDHIFIEQTVTKNKKDYRAVVVGTGGFGDSWEKGGDYCYRPGFLFVEIQGNIVRYWKYDTHECYTEKDPITHRSPTLIGRPKGRNSLKPHIQEYCQIVKRGKGEHDIKEFSLSLSIT